MSDEKERQNGQAERDEQNQDSDALLASSDIGEGAKGTKENKNESQASKAVKEVSEPAPGFWGRFLRVRAYEVLMLVFTFGIMYAAWTYTNFAGGQLHAMQGQLKAMERSLQLAHRPWVGVTHTIKASEPITFGPPNIVLKSAIPMKNFGPSVALNVVVVAGLTPSHDEIDSTMQFMCDVASQLSEGKSEPLAVRYTDLAVRRGGFALFPNQELVEPFESSVPSQPDLTTVYVVGCVAYRDQFKVMHETRFCFESPQADPKLTKNKFVWCHVYNDAN